MRARISKPKTARRSTPAPAGTVLYIGAAQGYGQWIVIDHPASSGGGVTEYGHMWNAYATGLRQGDRVEAGQLIGYVGSNGESSGPHLHLSVMPHAYNPAEKLDPMGWLAGADYPNGGAHVSARGLDYADVRPGGAAIRDSGYGFVVRYLSDGGASLPGKILTPEEADDLRAHGIDIVSNWETYADRMLEGYDAGRTDAKYARAQVLRCGGRLDRPIYFSADWDATPEQQSAIDAYLNGAASVIGAENVGVYGGYWVVKRCLDNGTARWGWQAEAWSGGNVDQRAHLRQLNNAGYAWVGGVQCDINESTTSDYGQWSASIGGVFMALSDDEQRELLTKTREVWDQLRGPDGQGWPQLGSNDQGQPLTPVDKLAEIGNGVDQLILQGNAIKPGAKGAAK